MCALKAKKIKQHTREMTDGERVFVNNAMLVKTSEDNFLASL